MFGRSDPGGRCDRKIFRVSLTILQDYSKRVKQIMLLQILSRLYLTNFIWTILEYFFLFYLGFSKLLGCPGTESENAGKSSACAGCPNQKICASAQPKLPDPGKLDFIQFY